jgi:hypothetical protein
MILKTQMNHNLKVGFLIRSAPVAENLAGITRLN